MKLFRKDQKGQSLVEFALIIPLLMIMLVGVFDVGRMLYTYTGMHFTAQETVRLGGFGYPDDEIISFAKDNFRTGDGELLEVNVSPDSGERKPGEYVTVTLDYSITPFTPFAKYVFSDSIQMSADSTIRIE
ncbi:TadE/TadG family type IV pilus assembly protein [Alkalibacillus aidingensis]|uniref:TadE/TadG family type IV pilus assembly protein n=1 Tax=Alkalibacillus aidingensis TaxID=2747607 RepID=UPI0016618072|nr:TadE/TadG family type IV pilus assembly protein [Alkalibacillus aidingensis]